MLKIKFWRLENIIFMKILEQDENLRGMGDWVDAETGLVIKSVNTPDLAHNTIFIRGVIGDDDNKISVCQYETEKKAIQELKKIGTAIKNFNIQYNTNGDQELENEIEQYIFK